MNNCRDTLCSLQRNQLLRELTIRGYLKQAMSPELSAVLRNQLRELTDQVSDARRIACQRGWDLPELSPAARFLWERKIRRQRSGRDNSSLAGLLILEYTEDMIQTFPLLHRCREAACIHTLIQKGIDSRRASIRQLEVFL